MENNFVQEYLNTLSTTSMKTSMQTLQKSLSQEFLSSIKRPSFIPFLKERDGMNKILAVNPINTENPEQQFSDEHYTLSTPKLRLRKKVKFIQITPLFPAVGSYNLQSDWIKRSYSTKNSNFSINSKKSLKTVTSESNTRPKIMKEEFKSKTVPEKKLRKSDTRFKEVFERKELRNVVQRALGTWNSLRIQGTPDEIKEELKFGQQKAAIKKYQGDIKILLNELKR